MFASKEQAGQDFFQFFMRGSFGVDDRNQLQVAINSYNKIKAAYLNIKRQELDEGLKNFQEACVLFKQLSQPKDMALYYAVDEFLTLVTNTPECDSHFDKIMDAVPPQVKEQFLYHYCEKATQKIKEVKDDDIHHPLGYFARLGSELNDLHFCSILQNQTRIAIQIFFQTLEKNGLGKHRPWFMAFIPATVQDQLGAIKEGSCLSDVRINPPSKEILKNLFPFSQTDLAMVLASPLSPEPHPAYLPSPVKPDECKDPHPASFRL